MIRRLLGVAALVSFFASTSATPASASIAFAPSQLCATWTTFSACASVSVTMDGGLPGNTGTVTVTNVSGTGMRVDRFGFYYLSGTNVGGATLGMSSPTITGWSAIGGEVIHGVIDGETWLVGGDASPASTPPTITNSQSITFNYTWGGGGTNDTWNHADLYWAWRGIGWTPQPGQDFSIKCFGSGAASSGLGGCDITVIPEPGSMVLLATGLVGLAGAGLIRRRRNEE